MPRFSDDWVVSKTLFEYTAGGECACCSFPLLFDPNGLKGLIASMTDLETDAANDEYNAAQNSPWPPEMRDSVWADRVRVRHKMKKEMADYKELIDPVQKEDLREFCINFGPKGLRKIFQIGRGDIAEMLGRRYNAGEGHAYHTIMCAVMEQVANFKLTKYDTDARGEEEIEFEGILKYDRFGGFVVDIAKESREDEEILEINHEILDVFLSAIKTLGGPKLLQRGPSSGSANGDGDDDEGGADDVQTKSRTTGKKGPSFRSDRRIVRLIILRYWADQIINKYKIEKSRE